MTKLGPITRVADAGEWPFLIETLASSFDADPAVRWMYPAAQQYQRHFPAFVRAFGGRAIEHGTAYCAEWYSGVALWLPPGIGPDEEALMALLESTVGECERSAIFAMLEQMGSYHPSEEHWYLPLLGVEASRQGEGYGSALMRQALQRCDQERRPAYLEATSRQSVPFYERHGFALLGTIQVGDSPPIFPMLRPAR
jgi:GNAT superfamily N-acetyltransferase